MSSLLEEYLDHIFEAKRTSMTRITRQTKIRKATGQLSSIMARKKHDPLYKLMMFHRDKYLKYREQVYKKYASRVRSKAMR
jgi:hypothetical protein